MDTALEQIDRTDPELESEEEHSRSRRKAFVLFFLFLFLLGIILGGYINKTNHHLDAKEEEEIIENVLDQVVERDTPFVYIKNPDSYAQVQGQNTQKPQPTTSNNNNSNPNPTTLPTVVPTNNPLPTTTIKPTPKPSTTPTFPPIPSFNPTPTPGPPSWLITGLKPHLEAMAEEDGTEFDITEIGMFGLLKALIKQEDTNAVIASFDINLTANYNWNQISAESYGNRSFFHYPGGFANLPGSAVSSYTLYVVKGIGNAVRVCPDADAISEVTRTCENGYVLNETATNVEIVTMSGTEYWSISGLTGTGAFSLIDNSDTLSRLEVGESSTHTIQFTTSYDINSSGDTITVDVVPNQLTTNGTSDFDFNGIDVSEIDFSDDGVDLTLCVGANPCSAAAGVWGVNIDSTQDTIIFTAPTDATATEVQAGSNMVLEIGTNATNQSLGTLNLLNPTNVNSYEIAITLENGTETDFGELEIPIIDDDTVNVTGYIDTFISFDIDTSEVDEDCDSITGVNPCDSHGGVSDNAGYVIDLGEMTTSSVNDSGDIVTHQDGIFGEINSIYFDLSTNANSGAAVTVQSLNAAMSGPGSIPTVADGSEVQITAGSGLYGINSFAGLTNTALSGSAFIHIDCDGTSGSDYFCDTPSSAINIFTTNGAPIDNLRLEWEIGVSPDALDPTGTYTDQLTFIATPTF